MNKLYFLSDLHLEFYSTIEEVKQTFSFLFSVSRSKDLLLLLGDIGNPVIRKENLVYFLRRISSCYQDVYYLPGNHEYYSSRGDSMSEMEKKLEKICSRISNLHFSPQTKINLNEEIVLLLTPFWSNVKKNIGIEEMIADYHSINSENGERVSIDDLNEIHAYQTFWLSNEIDKIPEGKKIIVGTHHPPLDNRNTFLVSSAKYKQMILTFSTDLPDLVSKVDVWLFGHTHTPCDFVFVSNENSSTHIASNPYGYQHEKRTVSNYFNNDLYINLF